jgi:hypothetical protein
MGYYDNILNLISVVLALSILFIIIFGCQFRKYRHIERFTNEGEETTETTSLDEKKEETKITPLSKSKDDNEELPPFEKDLLDKLKTGSMSDAEMQKLIDENIFKRENLEKMINYIDHAKKLS